MLYIYFGTFNWSEEIPLEVVHHIDAWFDEFYEDSWLKDDWAKRIIREIDKSEIVAPKVIQSPVLGTISHEWISGGSKSLIMMNHIQGILYSGNSMGANCYPYLMELASKKDIMIHLGYLPNFDWKEGDRVVCLNDNSVITTDMKFIETGLKFQSECRDVSFDEIKNSLPIEYGKLGEISNSSISDGFFDPE